MTPGIRTMLSLRELQGRSWMIRIVLFFVVGLLLSRLVEFALVSYDAGNWDTVVDRTSAVYLEDAERAFGGMQRSTRRVATELAQRQDLLDFLAGRTSDPTPMFALVSEMSRDQDVGIEVYDINAQLVAWDGRSGTTHRREIVIALDGQLTSYVSRSPVYSQLFVITPVRDEGKIIGAILVRKPIEVNYPLSNTFISNEGLAEQLSADLGVEVRFDFSPTATPVKDGRYVSSVLYGIDSSKVGVVSLMRPARSAYLESLHNRFQAGDAVMIVALLAVLSWSACWYVLRARSYLLRALGVTAVVWLVRYLLVWLEIPSSMIDWGIFDPAVFASQFGGGLARSVGELLISAAALAVNTAFLAHLVISMRREGRQPWIPSAFVGRGALAVAVTVILFWALRGYGAVIRSAVFDSTLRYNDPRMIFPSFTLAMMMVSLFIIGIALVILSAICADYVVALLRGMPLQDSARTLPWVLAAILFGVGSVVFGIVQETPLMSWGHRAVFGAGLLASCLYWARREKAGQSVASPGGFLLALGVTVLILYPLLDMDVHEKDRQRVEVFAADVIRPVDSWFTFVVDEALQVFAGDQTVDILEHGGPDDIQALAFSRWAQSLACKEGYTSLFSVTTPDGHEVSRFVIGGQIGLVTQVDSAIRPATTRGISVNESGSGINAIKVYAGSVPIVAPGDSILAYGHVIITASQQSLFRGENPAILRSASQENLENFYRPITVSEFRDGLLLTTTNRLLPIGYRLPEDVRSQFGEGGKTGVWSEETIEGTTFETYFARSGRAPDDIVALSLQELGFMWHLVNVVKILLYCSVFILAAYLVIVAARLGRGERRPLTFRAKLLIALLGTASVPVVLLAIYGRVYGTQRIREGLAQRLEDETYAVVQDVIDQPDTSEQGGPFSLSTETAEEIASDVGTDFSLYAGNMLRVSSRPELYEAGLLDTRLSGSAYDNVVLQGKRFYLETQRVGQFRYAVGYRPVLDSTGTIVGVVSVPTLYRQDAIEEDVTRRNAFVFATYGIAILLLVAIATTLANRIASPILRLTEATRRVAQGDLDVTLASQAAEGEIGELVSSFQSMTAALKKSREELVRYERELAWKEMAKQVAHEIKNPLTPMKLSIQHLRQTYRDRVPNFDQVMNDVTKTVIDQIEALSRIASEFSHFARMPRRALEACDVNALLKDGAQLFEQQRGIHVTMELAGDLPSVTADREELRRAFINILRNSVQAMEGRGNIVLTSVLAPAGVTVRFRDSGPGIPEEIRDKLFTPNFSTKTDGMGLGLAIVKKTVDDLGGTITIDSQMGSGTTVTIVLPPSQPADNGEPDHP